METKDKAIQKLVFEPYVDIERGTVVQQLTSNERKCLQRPSKSSCVVIGYVALICILVGVFAAYEGKYWWRLSIHNWVPHSGMLLYLHLRDFKIFFHPAKFDNFKDEKISDFKTVSVSQSKNLLDSKLVV